MSDDRTIELNPGERSRDPTRVTLKIVAGPHRGLLWAFERPARVTIGRDAPANIRLANEPAFSRRHCEIHIDPPTVRLVDLKSTNGTLVNGICVAEAFLNDGDEFGTGETTILVQMESTASHSVTPNSSSAPDGRQTNDPRSLANASASGDSAKGSASRPPVRARVVANRREQWQQDAGERPTDATGRKSSAADQNVTRQLESSSEASTSRAVVEQTLFDDRLASTFGAYELGKKLGQGGMAMVYSARHRKTSEEVAIKIIRSAVAPSDKMMQLFVREASVMLQLRHPRIVTCIEFGFLNQQPFLVMERIQTLNLFELTDGAPIEQRVRLSTWVVSRVLQALGYAHAKGIVHRDVKPGNILAYRDGRHLKVKLSDFGLAKCYEDAGFSAMTNDHSIRGTLAYMAPEQMRESRSVGPPADIFASGSCLYRLVSGQYPKVTADGVSSDPDSLIDLGVPKPLVHVITKAMHLDPNRRFSDASQMMRALNTFHLKLT